MTTTIDNGQRGRLVIQNVHDGEAGFATPKSTDAAQGAVWVAAFAPNIAKARIRPGIPVAIGIEPGSFKVISSVNSVAGLVHILIGRA